MTTTITCYAVRSSQRSFTSKIFLLRIFSVGIICHAVSASNDSETTSSCACPTIKSEFIFYDCDSNQGCFRCFTSNITISRKAVCDYVMDCPDLSDEMFCSLHTYQDNYAKKVESENNSQFNQSNGDIGCWNLTSSRYLSSLYTCENELLKKDCSNKTHIGRSSWQICNCSFQFCPSNNICPADCHSEGTCQDLEERSQVIQPFLMPLIVTGFLISASAILGNIAVLVVTASHLYRKHYVLCVEQRLTKYFFFSLSLSDLILAIYTVSICAVLQDILRSEIGDLQYNHWVMRCDVLGAMALIGSEQSVFTMLLITASRVYGIVRPFSRIRLKAFMISLIFCWMLSVLIATIPLMNALDDIFVHVIRQTDVPILTLITRESVGDLNDILQTYSNSVESSRPHGSWAKLLYFMEELFDVQTTYRFGYYHGLGLCLPNYFPMASSDSMWYSLMIFTTNTSCFVLMMIGYIVIYRHRRQPRNDISRTTADTTSEMSKLKRKIFLILVTDFMCWIPVCAVGFANIQRHRVKGRECNQSDIRDELTASLFAILLVLPINSAVNPFLYSAAPEYLHRKIVGLFVILKDKCISGKTACYFEDYGSSNSVGQNSTIVETISEYPESPELRTENIGECHL